MIELYQHQKEGVTFLQEAKRAVLADEMGLGKTIQAIKAAPEGGVVVVCPASLKTNWEREIKAVEPEADVEVVNGRKTRQTAPSEAQGGIHRWIIINYDILEAHLEEMTEQAKAGEIKTLILDEAHYIKGKSQRAKAAVALSQEVEQMYCLTGTPLLNRPIELWNMLVAIQHPITLEKGARTRFSKIYCGGFLKVIPPTRYRKFAIRFWSEDGATNLNELRRKLKGFMLRRKKKEVLDLPPKIIDVMEVELESEQRKMYENAWDAYLDFLSNNPPEYTTIDNILATRQLVEVQKLKQVCSQAKVGRIVADTLNAIEQDEKVIIFSQYVATIDQLKEKLTAAKIKVVTLTGSTKPADRQKVVDDFQNKEDVKVFIANIKAGGVGITLTEASIVMFADMDWSPEIHSQAEDRAHRIGQTGTVNVYYYVAKDTIEEDIIELLAKKKSIVQEVIDGTKERVSQKSVLGEFIKRMSEKGLST